MKQVHCGINCTPYNCSIKRLVCESTEFFTSNNTKKKDLMDGLQALNMTEMRYGVSRTE